MRLLELEYLEMGPGTATVRLPERPELGNHVGAQHAGALFTAAEAASGGDGQQVATATVDWHVRKK